MNEKRWTVTGSRWFAGCCMMGLVLAAGCLSSPERRIQKAPEVFAAFPPDVQAKVRKGEVDIGFTPDMVRLALGGPSRMRTRKTAAGEVEIWIYTVYRYGTGLRPIANEHWYRASDGRMYLGTAPVFISTDTREEYPVLRLEFEGGKVHSIERSR